MNSEKTAAYRVSVVIPCHNEEGNISPAVERIPDMGAGTEIVFVDDGSTDGTWRDMDLASRQNSRVRAVRLPRHCGKAAAVQEGIRAASGDVIMICDADLTVTPEELPPFLEPIVRGRADFVNGSRMIYPMEAGAMKFLNRLGNIWLGRLMSWIIGARITDTLCGTKVFRKKDFESVPLGLDPWGDYDLLFGAARMGLRIAEVPVHYRRRLTGQSKMKTFRHGLRILRRIARGLREIKQPAVES